MNNIYVIHLRETRTSMCVMLVFNRCTLSCRTVTVGRMSTIVAPFKHSRLQYDERK